MSKIYAVCQINGLIKFVEQAPSDGHFALAVGELATVRHVVRETCDSRRVGSEMPVLALYVPGTKQEAEDRENLSAIARYIQALDELEKPGFRALGA